MLHLFIRFFPVGTSPLLRRDDSVRANEVRRRIRISVSSPDDVVDGSVFSPEPALEAAVMDTLHISFLTTAIMKKDGKHVEYLAEASLRGMKWTITKRFKEFQTFHTLMSRKNSRVSGLPFPTKAVVGSAQTKFSMAMRRTLLQSYFMNLYKVLEEDQKQELLQFLGWH